MILIYGRTDDPPLALAIEALQEIGAPYALLAQSALDCESLQIEVGPFGVKGMLIVAGKKIDLEQICSVYARPLGLPARMAGSTNPARAQKIHENLFEWLDVSPALVVNRPRAMQANASKPMQAQLIGAAGFEVPATLVTSDEEEARAFWKEHGRVVYKSISGVRSIVTELSAVTAGRLKLLANLPTQFQAWVPGVDIRAHVVGEKTFAAEIQSSVIDYRYAEKAGGHACMTAIDLPAEVAAHCVNMSREMELPLAGIDLRRRPDGEFVCFEVNPMPAYSFFENQSGLPISKALAEMLMNGLNAPQEGARLQHASD